MNAWRIRGGVALGRMGWPILLASTAAIGVVSSLWPSLSTGDQTLTPARAVATMSGPPRIIILLVVWIVSTGIVGGDRDTGLVREHRLSGVSLPHTRCLDALWAMCVALLLTALSAAFAALVGLGNLLVTNASGRGGAAWAPAIVHTAASGIACAVVAVLAVSACGWSARAANAGVLVLLGTFFGLLRVAGGGSVLVKLHPVAGPWRLLYHGQSPRLVVDLTAHQGLGRALAWAVLVALASALMSRHLSR